MINASTARRNVNNCPTYACFKGTLFVGFVNAISHASAVARAHGRFGICDVELSADRKPRPSDRLSANECQSVKTARRYPTPGFSDRRAALIAAHKAGE